MLLWFLDRFLLPLSLCRRAGVIVDADDGVKANPIIFEG